MPVPPRTPDGFYLGTLGLDTESRQATEEETQNVQPGALVAEELDLRLSARRRVAAEGRLRRQAEEVAGTLQASLLPPRPPTVPAIHIATGFIAVSRACNWAVTSTCSAS